MHRRLFSQALMGLGGLATAGSALPLAAQTVSAPNAGAFREGTHYRRLRQPAPVDAPAGRIEVLEFFAYTCIHCYNFVPQKLYFTLEAMGQLDTLHERVFKAIHNDRQRLNNADAITAWVAAQGVDKAQFTQVFNSFAIAGKVRRANQLQDAYEVEATPSLGIAGRYYVPGQAARTLTIANALIQEARKG